MKESELKFIAQELHSIVLDLLKILEPDSLLKETPLVKSA